MSLMRKLLIKYFTANVSKGNKQWLLFIIIVDYVTICLRRRKKYKKTCTKRKYGNYLNQYDLLIILSTDRCHQF